MIEGSSIVIVKGRGMRIHGGTNFWNFFLRGRVKKIFRKLFWGTKNLRSFCGARKL